MTRLVQAFQKKDIVEFEKILAENQECIMGDPFIKSHIDQVLVNIRSQVLIKLVRPYTKIELCFISQKLNISIREVEDLLFSLILDKQVLGRIDQVSNILELGPCSPCDEALALANLAVKIEGYFQNLISKVI